MKKAKRVGEVCVKQRDGSYSDAAIHGEIMAGIDDSDIRALSRLKLRAEGVPAYALNRLFPDLPPLEV